MVIFDGNVIHKFRESLLITSSAALQNGMNFPSSNISRQYLYLKKKTSHFLYVYIEGKWRKNPIISNDLNDDVLKTENFYITYLWATYIKTYIIVKLNSILLKCKCKIILNIYLRQFLSSMPGKFSEELIEIFLSASTELSVGTSLHSERGTSSSRYSRWIVVKTRV